MGGPIEITIDDEFPVKASTGTTVGGYKDADSLPIYRIYGVAGGATSNLVASGTLIRLDASNTTGAYNRTLTCDGNTYTAAQPYDVYTQATVGGITASDIWTFIARANDADSVEAAVAAVGATATLILADTATLAAMAATANLTYTAVATDIPATLSAMQGAGFTTSTDSLEAIRNQGDSAWITGVGGGGGDATAAKQDEIIADLDAMAGGGFTTSTDSLEAIRIRGDAAWVTGAGGAGAFEFTWTIEDAGNPVPNAVILASSTNSDAGLLTQGTTDTAGQLTLNFTAAGPFYYKVLPPTGFAQGDWIEFTAT